MQKPELKLKLTVNTSEVIDELSRLNELLVDASVLIDSISEKIKNLTVTQDTHR